MNDQQIGNPARELAKRFLITFLLGVVVYRGYCRQHSMSQLRHCASSDGAFGYFPQYANMFNGGALSSSIFGLGIMPYISASIILQLTHSFPQLKQLQKEGEVGRRKLAIYSLFDRGYLLGAGWYGFCRTCSLGRTGLGCSRSGIKHGTNHFLSGMIVITTGSMVLLGLLNRSPNSVSVMVFLLSL